MTTYGFRVFKFRIQRYSTPRRMLWDEVPAVGYLDHLEHSSRILIDEQGGVPDDAHVLTSPPFEVGATYTDIDLLQPGQTLTPSNDRPRQVARWFPLSVTRSKRRASFAVLAGTRDDFATAIGTGGDSTLENKAAARRYRAELLIPATPERTALLAVEAAGEYCPSLYIARLLGLASKRLALADKTGSGTPPWFHPSLRQVLDPGYLADLIADADAATVVLKHDGQDASNDQSTRKFRAEWSGLSVTQLGRLVEWVRAPVPERKARGMGGMLEILGKDDADFDEAIDEYYVRLKAEGRPATKIYPESEVEKFTYPIGNRQPSQQEWHNQVRERLAIIDESLAWD